MIFVKNIKTYDDYRKSAKAIELYTFIAAFSNSIIDGEAGTYIGIGLHEVLKSLNKQYPHTDKWVEFPNRKGYTVVPLDDFGHCRLGQTVMMIEFAEIRRSYNKKEVKAWTAKFIDGEGGEACAE